MATDSTIDNLHHACFHGLLDKVKQLHSQGIRLNARCSAGQTPLSSSTLGGRVKVIKYLIANGADVDEQDSKGKFALYFAVAREKPRTMWRLVLQRSRALRSVLVSGLARTAL